ncbi:MAG: hypothetical protein ACWA49_03760 [Ruegeria sp.]
MEALENLPTGAVLSLFGSSGAAAALFVDTKPDLVAKGLLVDTQNEQDIARNLTLDVPAEWLTQVESSLPHPDNWDQGSFLVELSELPKLEVRIHYFNPETKTWSGEIHNRSSDESVKFTFQEFHSPDVTVVVVIVLGVLCGIGILSDLIKGCEKRAVKVCGEGNVKSVKTKKSWAGIASCSLECEFECRD